MKHDEIVIHRSRLELYDQDDNNITDAMIPDDPSQIVLKKVEDVKGIEEQISEYIKFELKKALTTNSHTHTFISTAGNSYAYSTNHSHTTTYQGVSANFVFFDETTEYQPNSYELVVNWPSQSYTGTISDWSSV